jgi:Ni/Co efflux regulator RcnB
MKYVLPLVGVALALSLSGTAYAADHDRGQRGDRGRDRDNHVTQQHNNNGQRFDRGNRQRGPVVQQQQQPQWQPGQRGGNRWRDNDHRPRGPVVNNNNGWRPPVSNGWRNQHSRSNWQQYRRNYEAPRRFRIGIYHGPRGFHYRRWSYGEYLPSSYYARPFWLLNAIAYGLFSPPPGLIWVRYGDDALLIDQYTGEIVQVRYDVFY